MRAAAGAPLRRQGPGSRPQRRVAGEQRRGGAGAEWIAFLDDDVVPFPSWAVDLSRDLDGLAPEVGGSCGRIVVPLPAGRRATDWERNVAGLETARWATADLAYRRTVLERVGASTIASRAPTARTPTWPCASSARATSSCRARAWWSIPFAPPIAG